MSISADVSSAPRLILRNCNGAYVFLELGVHAEAAGFGRVNSGNCFGLPAGHCVECCEVVVALAKRESASTAAFHSRSASSSCPLLKYVLPSESETNAGV